MQSLFMMFMHLNPKLKKLELKKKSTGNNPLIRIF